MLVYITNTKGEYTSFTAVSESFEDLLEEIEARFGSEWQFGHSK